MNSLAILLLLLIEDSVLVFGQHFLLPRHLRVPPLDGFGVVSVSLESCADGVDDTVDGAEALPLSRFLGL